MAKVFTALTDFTMFPDGVDPRSVATLMRCCSADRLQQPSCCALQEVSWLSASAPYVLPHASIQLQPESMPRAAGKCLHQLGYRCDGLQGMQSLRGATSPWHHILLPQRHCKQLYCQVWWLPMPSTIAYVCFSTSLQGHGDRLQEQLHPPSQLHLPAQPQWPGGERDNNPLP